jgi:Holliday junction resolvasome RuvABC DNA-binding subunit
MIAFIEGDLIECQLNLAIIQVGGIGYEVHIPLTTSEKLPPLGQEIKLFTQACTGRTPRPFTVSPIANPGISSA